MVRNVLAADRVEIIHCGMQPNRSGDIRGAGFESMRRRLPGALMIIDRQNHLTTTFVGRRFLEPLRSSVKNAKASRPAHFMARKNQEVAADLLHIQRPMSGA